jgi:hypothetical protein
MLVDLGFVQYEWQPEAVKPKGRCAATVIMLLPLWPDVVLLYTRFAPLLFVPTLLASTRQWRGPQVA